MERIAGIERRLRFDQIACKQRLRLRVPCNDIARRVTATAISQFDRAAIAAERYRKIRRESLRGPCQARDALWLFEKPRHASIFAIPVFSAALLDQCAGRLTGNDMRSRESARPQHPDCVIVSQDQITHGFISELAQLL